MFNKSLFKYTLVLLLISIVSKTSAIASINLVDDNNHLISTTYPAKRIISLSPHITELIFAAGGEKYLVGTVDSSNYPNRAKNIEKIGSSHIINIERIVALKPDLIIAWNSSPALEKIKRLNKSILIFISHPNRVKDISNNLVKFGKLMNTEKIANQSAIIFNDHIRQLSNLYKKQKKVSLIFLISKRPLIAFSGGDLLFQDTLEFCGGKNLFEYDKKQTVMLSIESIRHLKPDIMFSLENPLPDKNLGLQNNPFWNRQININQNNLLQTISIEADLIARPGPRYWQGVKKICNVLSHAHLIGNKLKSIDSEKIT